MSAIKAFGDRLKFEFDLTYSALAKDFHSRRLPALKCHPQTGESIPNSRTSRLLRRWYRKPDGNLLDVARDAAIREVPAALVGAAAPLLEAADRAHREFLTYAKECAYFGRDWQEKLVALRESHQAALRAIRVAMPSPVQGTAIDETEPPELVGEEIKILEALHKSHPRPLVQADIAAEAELERKTVGKYLPGLQGKGLVKSVGERKGNTITAAGQRIISK